MVLTIPRHVALIPDGNRRWALARGLVGEQGYEKAGSFENLRTLFNEARRLGVQYFSLWGFSTENWKRGKREIDSVFRLIFDGLRRFGEESAKEKICFRHLGRRDRLPKELVREIEELEDRTKKYKDFIVQLCLDYGGRDEIVRAVNRILKEGREAIDEKSFVAYLDSKVAPEPDLIIRTSGERRLSGFMAYQGIYAELYFTDVYFPEFGPAELRKAIGEFSRRKRRFGGD